MFNTDKKAVCGSDVILTYLCVKPHLPLSVDQKPVFKREIRSCRTVTLLYNLGTVKAFRIALPKNIPPKFPFAVSEDEWFNSTSGLVHQVHFRVLHLTITSIAGVKCNCHG